MIKSSKLILMGIVFISSATANAFERKACIESFATNSQDFARIDALTMKLNEGAITLLSAGVDSDYSTVISITGNLDQLSATANGVNIALAVRQAGTFKNQVGVDKLVDSYISNYYRIILNNIKTVGKWQSMVKNSKLRSDISEVVGELERLSERQKSCGGR